MWERACSRRRSVSQQKCWLTHRFREQARSHRDVRCNVRAGSLPQGCVLQCESRRSARSVD
ncbi:hypothetical protein DBR18_17445 [Pseudomonas sp. HMWF021]|nr:hypothetical protein DBR18_17445 [Pseudomonas sp. HMWF021]